MGALELAFTAGCVEVGGKAHIDMKDVDKVNVKDFKVDWYSDCLIDTVPQTIEEAIETIKTLPGEITNQNDGKGVPLQYTFTSIKSLQKMFEDKIQQTQFIKALGQGAIEDCLELVDKFDEVLLDIGDLEQVLTFGKEVCGDETIKKVGDIRKDVSIHI